MNSGEKEDRLFNVALSKGDSEPLHSVPHQAKKCLSSGWFLLGALTHANEPEPIMRSLGAR